MVRLGVVSDTHGVVPSNLAELFRGRVDRIVHCGDIGVQQVVTTLSQLAPLDFIRGNADCLLCFRDRPESELIELDGWRVLVVHALPAPARITAQNQELINRYRPQVVLYGHTHKAAFAADGGIAFINPGYAGPAFGGVAPGAVLLTLDGLRGTVEFFDLSDTGAGPLAVEEFARPPERE